MNKVKEFVSRYKILVAVICVCIIGGCAYGIYASFSNNDQVSYSTSVTDGDKTLLTIDGVDISKDDLYDYYLEDDGVNLTLNAAVDYITSKEITDKDAINKEVESLKQQYVTYIGSDIATYAKENGYKDEQDFVDQMIMPTAKTTLLQKKYVSQEYNNLLKTYKVKYLKTITVDTESQALKMIKECKDEASFNNLFTQNNGSDLGFVTKESTSVDENVIKKLDKFTKDGIYAKAIKTSDSKYVIIWVYNTDKSKLKDEITTSLLDISNISSKAETYYLKKYNFDVYDEALKKQIKEVSKDYFG